MNQNFMKEKKILHLVVSMSLPMVLSMAVNSLYNIVDSFFVANISEDAMTALSLVYPIQNVVSSIAVGFGVGLNARIAYYLGAKKKIKSDEVAITGMVLSVIHGILVMALCWLGMPKFLEMYTNDQHVIDLGLEYANRAFLFAVIIMTSISLEKIFQAVGRMKVSMISMSLGCITNIILDPLMIFGIGPFPRMEMAGAAWATGIGQTVCLLSYIIFLYARPIPVNFRKKNITMNRKLLSGLYSVGIPATLNMALPSFLISALNGILAPFSAKYVLVLGAYYKLQTFIYLTANGIIQGIRPLVSFNYGAGEHKRVDKIFNTTLALTAAVMGIGLILSYLIPSQLMGLFTSNPETLSIGVNALHIISIGFVFSALSVTSCGVLEALGMGIPSLVVSALRYVIIIIPAAMILAQMIGSTGVFLAFPIAEILTAFISYLIYVKCYRHSEGLHLAPAN